MECAGRVERGAITRGDALGEAAGKLKPLDTTSRAYEGDPKKAPTVNISPVSSLTGTYYLNTAVNGHIVSFLLDTGAATTLLRENTWDRVKTSTSTLQPAYKKKLVGVDGTPLWVLGQGWVDLDIGGKIYLLEIIVVSSLTSPAILGLDFLQEYAASVDFRQKVLLLAHQGGAVKLSSTMEPVGRHPISAAATADVVIPLRSEMEITANVSTRLGKGEWLVEEHHTKPLKIAVAAGVLRGNTCKVPIRVINTKCPCYCPCRHSCS